MEKHKNFGQSLTSLNPTNFEIFKSKIVKIKLNYAVCF